MFNAYNANLPVSISVFKVKNIYNYVLTNNFYVHHPYFVKKSD